MEYRDNKSWRSRSLISIYRSSVAFLPNPPNPDGNRKSRTLAAAVADYPHRRFSLAVFDNY
uniref:Uncharacterized protein n=1 Tax=Oryza meridionalis TaxID=40149 RepID=A0A0E0D4W4_9ORYZ